MNPYVQAVSPNLDTLGQIGWCLSFVENVFSTPHLYATATDGWNSCELRHGDRNFPDLAVPVWFSYIENGINFGHVAVWVPGLGVLSSPYRYNNTHQWFSSIEQCERVLRCSYLGWSEDLATIKLITKGDEMITTREQAVMMYHLLRPNSEPSEEEINGTVGQRSFAGFLNDAQVELQARNASLAEKDALIAQLHLIVSNDEKRITELSTPPITIAKSAAAPDITNTTMTATNVKEIKPLSPGLFIKVLGWLVGKKA